MVESDVKVLHLLDKNLKSICGSNWEWGRIEKDFINYTLADDFIKCNKCIEELTKRTNEQLGKENNERQ